MIYLKIILILILMVSWDWKKSDLAKKDVTKFSIIALIFFKNKKINLLHTVSRRRIGRGDLVLRQTVPHFPPSSGGIACSMAEVNAALCLDTRAKKWKYKCNLIFRFLEWGSNPQPVDITVTLCAPAPRLASK